MLEDMEMDESERAWIPKRHHLDRGRHFDRHRRQPSLNRFVRVKREARDLLRVLECRIEKKMVESTPCIQGARNRVS